MPVEALDLTVRSYNCLKREGIHTVGELITRSEADLMDIRNFGAKSIDEVKDKLISMGIALKDSPPGFDPSQYASAFDDDYSDEEEEAFVPSGSYATFQSEAAPAAVVADDAAADDDQSFAEDEQL
jgi:DNA-directed RNA polymerase subunit alpha